MIIKAALVSRQAQLFFVKYPDNGFSNSGEKTPPLPPPEGGEKTLTLHFVKIEKPLFLSKDTPIIFSKICSPLPQLGEVGRGLLYLFTPKVSPFTS